MNAVPRSKNGMIQFYNLRVPKWAENAGQIGTTPEAVADVAAKTEAARQAYQQQRAAMRAARSATQRLDNALKELATAGSSIIMQIRARARVEGDGVYALASVSPPDDPSPTEAPGMPQELKVSLAVTGQLLLEWTCDNPRGTSGTIYQVWRRVDHAGQFEYIGGSGKKFYVDSTLPAGTTSVTYQIQAFRSTKAGPPAQFNLQFGGVDPAFAKPFIRAKKAPLQWGPRAA